MRLSTFSVEMLCDKGSDVGCQLSGAICYPHLYRGERGEYHGRIPDLPNTLAREDTPTKKKNCCSRFAWRSRGYGDLLLVSLPRTREARAFPIVWMSVREDGKVKCRMSYASIRRRAHLRPEWRGKVSTQLSPNHEYRRRDNRPVGIKAKNNAASFSASSFSLLFFLLRGSNRA
jgi:hypothetical protein